MCAQLQPLYTALASKRQKGDNTIGFYTVNTLQLLMTMQLYCRRAIASVDAFPCAGDFDYQVEDLFKKQAVHFVRKGCECIYMHLEWTLSLMMCTWASRATSSCGYDEGDAKSCEFPMAL